MSLEGEIDRERKRKRGNGYPSTERRKEESEWLSSLFLHQEEEEEKKWLSSLLLLPYDSHTNGLQLIKRGSRERE